MMVYYILIIGMTLMGATASLFLKKASGSDGIKKLIINPNLYLGGMIYVISALLNIWVLNYLDYSVALPLTSLTYIWTMIFSYFVLKEKVTAKKIIGVFCIIGGAVLVAL